jgi:hypothetical protein
MTESKADQLSQRIEREVRQVIGDLHMQIIVLRCLTELRGQEPKEQPKPEPQTPQPNPTPQEHPEPGHPGPSPDVPPPSPSRSPVPDPARGEMNGRYQEKIAR